MAIAKKKKRFFDVMIPAIGKTTHLQAYDISELDGRFIKYDLTRFLKGKSMILTSKVIVKDDKASSSPTKITLMSYFLKRMIRKGTTDRLILTRGLLVSPMATNRLIPKGGVRNPNSISRTMTTPKCMGSILKRVSVVPSRGAIISMAATSSMTVPIIRKRTLMRIRNSHQE